MPPTEDPRALARRLAAEARARSQAKGGAGSRADAWVHKRPSQPMSAQEALAAALAAEETAPAEPEPPPRPEEAAPRKPARVKKAANPEAEAQAQQALAKAEATKAKASRPTTPQRRTKSPAALLSRRLPAFTIEQILTVQRREAFRATWAAHRSRAELEQDLPLMATADRLVLAAKDVPDGALHAARMIDAERVHWAVFLDGTTGRLLAAVQPADTFLAGSS